MVNQDMAVDQELVHDDSAFEAEFAKHGLDTELHDELGGFTSIDDLEDFLRTFEAGSEDEASLATQGDDDVGGEPLSTVH